MLVGGLMLGACRNQSTKTQECTVPNDALAEETESVAEYNVSFSKPIAGYEVDIKLFGERNLDRYELATIHCKSADYEFSVDIPDFESSSLGFDYADSLETNGRIVLDYPVFKEHYNNLDEPFYFLDADFDGSSEFLVRAGTETYNVYEITDDGLELKDYGPFAWIDCFTSIDPKKKTILLFVYQGGGHFTEAQFTKAEVRFTGKEVAPEGNGSFPAEAILRDYYKGTESDFRLDWIKHYNPDDDITTQLWPEAALDEMSSPEPPSGLFDSI